MGEVTRFALGAGLNLTTLVLNTGVSASGFTMFGTM